MLPTIEQSSAEWCYGIAITGNIFKDRISMCIQILRKYLYIGDKKQNQKENK